MEPSRIWPQAITKPIASRATTIVALDLRVEHVTKAR